MQTSFRNNGGELIFSAVEDFRPWQCYLGASPVGLPGDYLVSAVGVDGRYPATIRRFSGFRLIEDLKRNSIPPVDIGATGESSESLSLDQGVLDSLQQAGTKVIKEAFPFSISQNLGNARRKTGVVLRVANTDLATNLFGFPNRTDINGDLVVILYAEDDEDLLTFPASDVTKFGMVFVTNPHYSDGGTTSPRSSRSYPGITLGKNGLLDIIGNGWRYTQDSVADWKSQYNTSSANWFPLVTTGKLRVWHSERFIYIGSESGEFDPIVAWFDPALHNNQGSKRSPGWFFDPMGPGIDIPARCDVFPTTGARNNDGSNVPAYSLTYDRPAKYDDTNWTFGGTSHTATNDPLWYWLGLVYKQDATSALVTPQSIQPTGVAFGGPQEFRTRLIDYYRGRYAPLSSGSRLNIAENKTAVVVGREYDGLTTGRYYANTATHVPGIYYDLEALLWYKYSEIYATLSLDNSLTNISLPNASLGALHLVDSCPNKNYNIRQDKSKYLSRYAYTFPQFYNADGTYSGGYPENRWNLIALLFSTTSRGQAFQNWVQGSPVYQSGYFADNTPPQVWGDNAYRYMLQHSSVYIGSPNTPFDAYSDYYALLVNPLGDNEIAANPSYNHATDEAGLPPKRILAGAYYQGINFIATDKQATPIPFNQGDNIAQPEASGRIVITYSPTTKNMPEVFPTLNRYVTNIPIGPDCFFMEAGDTLFLVGAKSIVRIQRNGVGVQFVEYAFTNRPASHFSGVPYKDVSIVALGDGFYQLNPTVSAPQSIGQLDRLFQDLWIKDTSQVSMAYDQELDAIFILDGNTGTAAVMWREDQKITQLEDMVYIQVFPMMINGSQRAVFVSDSGRFVTPRINPHDGLEDIGDDEVRPHTTCGIEWGSQPNKSLLLTVKNVALVTGGPDTLTKITLKTARHVFGPDAAINPYYPTGSYYWKGHFIYHTNTGQSFRIRKVESNVQFGPPATDDDAHVYVVGNYTDRVKTGDVLAFSPVPMRLTMATIPSGNNENSGTQKRKVNYAHANVQWYRTNPNLGIPLFQGGVVDYAVMRKKEPLQAVPAKITSNDQVAKWVRTSPSESEFPGLFATPMPNMDRSVTSEVLNPVTVSGYFAGEGHLLFPWVHCCIPGLEMELHSVEFGGTITMSEFQQDAAKS